MVAKTPEAFEMIGSEPPSTTARLRMSFEDFLAWDDERTMSEWVDGQVLVMAPASSVHQRVGSLLLQTLGLYVEMHELGEVLAAPFVMRMAELGTTESMNRFLSRADGTCAPASSLPSDESLGYCHLSLRDIFGNSFS